MLAGTIFGDVPAGPAATTYALNGIFVCLVRTAGRKVKSMPLLIMIAIFLLAIFLV